MNPSRIAKNRKEVLDNFKRSREISNQISKDPLKNSKNSDESFKILKNSLKFPKETFEISRNLRKSKKILYSSHKTIQILIK